MEYGICPLSVVPVRAEPRDSAEQVTQLLFGESIEILSKDSPWVRIRCLLDNYEGWIDEKQWQPVSEKYVKGLAEKTSYSLDVAQSVTNQTHHIPITLGATLPYYDGINIKLGDHKYWFNGQAYDPATHNHKPAVLEKIAHKFHYAPYLWGGRSPFGVDCSGLTQVVYKMLGITVPRDSHQQAEVGKDVIFMEGLKVGDLAFFENKAGKIAHVGIVLSDQRIIHAYGRVRIDKLDHYGIYNEAQQKYTHRLRVIRRLL